MVITRCLHSSVGLRGDQCKECVKTVIDTAIAQAVASERQRCATILREHICNYCDHDHAEYMAQLVLEGTP